MSSLRALPAEINVKILEYCTKRDLVNVAVCSSFWKMQVVPMLWKEILIEWKHLLHRNISCKTANLQYTRSLILNGNGRREKSGNYDVFNFGFIVRNCNPAKLTSLTIERFDVTDGFRLISETLPMLKCLELSYVFDDHSFDFVSDFKHLEIAMFSFCSLKDKQVMKICLLKKLAVLGLCWCPHVTSKSLEYISEVAQLKELKLQLFWPEERKHNDRLFNTTITKLPNLLRLEIQDSPLDDTLFILGERNFQPLELLVICSSRISNLGLATISRLRNLKHLDVSSCKGISDEGLASLHFCRLNYLCLCCTNISDAGLLHVSRISTLTVLDVCMCDNVTDVGLQHISKLQNLTVLNISGIDALTDKGFVWIKNLKYLRILDIESLHLTNASLETLSKMKFLEQLNVTNCSNLSDDGLSRLSNLKRLKKLVRENR